MFCVRVGTCYCYPRNLGSAALHHAACDAFPRSRDRCVDLSGVEDSVKLKIQLLRRDLKNSLQIVEAREEELAALECTVAEQQRRASSSEVEKLVCLHKMLCWSAF